MLMLESVISIDILLQHSLFGDKLHGLFKHFWILYSTYNSKKKNEKSL